MQVFPTGGCGVKGVCSLVNFIAFLFADRTYYIANLLHYKMPKH